MREGVTDKIETAQFIGSFRVCQQAGNGCRIQRSRKGGRECVAVSVQIASTVFEGSEVGVTRLVVLPFV